MEVKGGVYRNSKPAGGVIMWFKSSSLHESVYLGPFNHIFKSNFNDKVIK